MCNINTHTHCIISLVQQLWPDADWAMNVVIGFHVTNDEMNLYNITMYWNLPASQNTKNGVYRLSFVSRYLSGVRGGCQCLVYSILATLYPSSL